MLFGYTAGEKPLHLAPCESSLPLICTLGQQWDSVGQNLINPNQSVDWLRLYCGQILHICCNPALSSGSLQTYHHRECDPYKIFAHIPFLAIHLQRNNQTRVRGAERWGRGHDWHLCLSITDRKSMTQLMMHKWPLNIRYCFIQCVLKLKSWCSLFLFLGFPVCFH